MKLLSRKKEKKKRKKRGKNVTRLCLHILYRIGSATTAAGFPLVSPIRVSFFAFVCFFFEEDAETRKKSEADHVGGRQFDRTRRVVGIVEIGKG